LLLINVQVQWRLIINVNSMFLQKQIFSLVLMIITNVDSMFLQKQIFSLVSTTVVNADLIFSWK